MLSSINVNKNKLLNMLYVNKQKHIEIVEEAKQGYIAKAKQVFEEKLKKIVEIGIVDTDLQLTKPIDHIKDYDEAIAMLEWETKDEIELERNQFNCFVLDNWNWKNNFLVSNVQYSSIASGIYYK